MKEFIKIPRSDNEITFTWGKDERTIDEVFPVPTFWMKLHAWLSWPIIILLYRKTTRSKPLPKWLRTTPFDGQKLIRKSVLQAMDEEISKKAKEFIDKQYPK